MINFFPASNSFCVICCKELSFLLSSFPTHQVRPTSDEQLILDRLSVTIGDMAKHIIQFHISRGLTHYVAEGIDLPVVTQGKTLDELIENLKEAVELQLEGENVADFGLAAHPSILLNMELPVPAHA